MVKLNVKVLASTSPGQQLDLEMAKSFSGKSAGICYMPDSFEAILAEPTEKTMKRANQTLLSGHHSVFDHISYSLLLEGLPKILAMVLNNEKVYSTSEKSARYTRMQPSEREIVIYDKWQSILAERIMLVYPETSPEKAKKLAQENARYMISVFTPTTMEYTTTLRQWNYIIHWFKKFISEESPNALAERLKEPMVEFVEKTQFLFIPSLNDEAKGRSLSLFDSRIERQESFGESYCTTYLGSFAQLAQAHRHRTLDYKMRMLDEPQYFIPSIITNDDQLVIEWLSDIKSVSNLFPQGMMISIRERGTYENFILKTKERLCSSAQLEISLQTWKTLQLYLAKLCLGNTRFALDSEVFSILNKYNYESRCGAGFKCVNPCEWGLGQLERLV